MTNKTNLKNCTLKELENYLESLGEKKFRAKQIYQWIYRGVCSFQDMTDLSKGLREKLEESATIECLELLQVQHSKTDETKKYLFGLQDGNKIESVFMKYKFGNSICLSSQAGCRMGCEFCASTIGGLKRNLTAGEIMDQILCVQRDTGEKISHIVVMGTGEPFDNYENLSKFIYLVNSKEGLNIGMRNITVSTCGILPKIADFAADFPQVNLAISLHAPNDEIRNQTMPVNKTYNTSMLLEACRDYTKKTGRRVTFEYALVSGVNDQSKHAEELAKMLKGMLCHVNLIPLNNVQETGLKGSSRKEAQLFKDRLEQLGIPTTVRRELGSDINAACGQLRLTNSEDSL
ncbi:23S rRNA (adenine(2503)-C(2))-methyltransferase RlmN [Clostridium aminobutyricum]|uniref:Probable dual-specificity RNA methyltransferase RlmN n=1 Tax=Clostridium aminobutyricum TaxID=33953 RepID=A0A939D875_CLOAM|nr:23S rRNA (adenine(2503)-C(2))-methyltransferase RlmN [Clostridium aminobutyricum]MBN7772867.1 23S rRNA (adenine(2503)-C(2))-methyltransferase RlmN [Clostridium aminobutyricum]